MQAVRSAIHKPASWTQPIVTEQLFANPAPLDVDLGCGKGRFLLARAAANPATNFIGIDKLLKRLNKIDKKILRAELNNVSLLHVEAAYAVENLFIPSTVSIFYIFFPDPWPKRRHCGRRLFSTSVVNSLYKALISGGCIHIATDHLDYFNQIRKLFDADSRFAKTEPLELPENEQTDFEMLFTKQNAKIGRCAYRKQS